MEIPTLDTALVRLTNVFPYYLEFILALMALGGLLCVASGLIMGYRQASAGGRGQSYGDGTPTPWKSIGLILLGGTLSVPLVLMWDVAGTFVLGGSETYNILSYLPPPNTSPWCDRVKAAVILFFMCMGITAIGWAGVLANERIGSTNAQGVTLKIIGFGLGGLACFFVTDVATLLSNTFGMNVSLDNVCSIMGSGSEP